MRPRTELLLASLLPALLLLSPGCKRDKKASKDPDSAGSDDRYGGGPTPNEVCTHLFRMAAADAGQPDAPLDQQIIGECIGELESEVPIRGPEGWAQVASCVVAARGEEDIDACDRRYPLPYDGSSPGDSGDASVEDLTCIHMLQVVMAETAQEEGQVPDVSEDQLRSLHGDCVQSLLQGEKPARSPESYQGLLDCIQGASSSAQMQACE